MYKIRVFQFPSKPYYELYYGYNNYNLKFVYPIFIHDSEKVTKILFLKGIKLEEGIETDIDIDTFNLLYPYTIQHSTT